MLMHKDCEFKAILAYERRICAKRKINNHKILFHLFSYVFRTWWYTWFLELWVYSIIRSVSFTHDKLAITSFLSKSQFYNLLWMNTSVKLIRFLSLKFFLCIIHSLNFCGLCVCVHVCAWVCLCRHASVQMCICTCLQCVCMHVWHMNMSGAWTQVYRCTRSCEYMCRSYFGLTLLR